MRSCASRSTPLKSAALMPIEPRKPSVCSTNSRLSAPISEKRAKKVSHLGHPPRAIDVSWTCHGRARARAKGGVPPLLHRLERVEEGELAERVVPAVALAHLDQRRVVAAELLVLRPHHLALKGRLLPAEGRRRHRLRARQLRHHIRLPRRRLLGGRAEVTGGLHTPRGASRQGQAALATPRPGRREAGMDCGVEPAWRRAGRGPRPPEEGEASRPSQRPSCCPPCSVGELIP
mmetsp:Transcript_39011/g.129150  ORF Transcript_39011/g.129150 Transcript_39011/m.129150 type:complete len:233 (+) Transcript_39011:238-936(+)